MPSRVESLIRKPVSASSRTSSSSLLGTGAVQTATESIEEGQDRTKEENSNRTEHYDTTLKNFVGKDDNILSETDEASTWNKLHEFCRRFLARRMRSHQQFESSDYIRRRSMTTTQERLNAITVLPSAGYCLFYLLSGKWLLHSDSEASFLSQSQTLYDIGKNKPACLNIPALPNLYAVPPFPVIVIALGIILHAPFSFIYHWRYATILPPGLALLEHWSRRMDQAFIHVISACMSYGTSGRLDYFFVNLLFNGYCIKKMFHAKATPRKAQIRIFVSVIAYTMPFLYRGDAATFIELWVILALGVWLFSTYPIRGWSHAAFHVVIALVPPICMEEACELDASKEQILKAAACAALDGEQ